ncbi:hypothetical protein HK099_008044 [Clydaea vesicula]|uniref:Uncharacterized protein n=1 Tax=Clydaea vesicula TaxID=447962 RepID=A0AAD5TWA8_9FUNG|nr:hypothetical protein HK099_008044 [Clydaea vesicula]
MSTTSIQQTSTRHYKVCQFKDNTSSFRKIEIESLDVIFKDVFDINDIERKIIDSFVRLSRSKIKIIIYIQKNHEQIPLFLICSEKWVHTKEISSIYDFSVERKRIIMLVEEEKNSRNITVIKGRKLIKAAAYNNLNNIPIIYSENIYGVKVVGLKFTFYKAVKPIDDLTSLTDGMPDMNIRIYRFPPQGNNKELQALNYSIGDDRKRY